MGKLRYTTWWKQLICLFMALHVINLSLDAPDRYTSVLFSSDQHEDLSLNEMESFGELLLEQVLGFDNAVPEHDDAEDEANMAPIGPDYFFHQPFAFTVAPANWYVLPLHLSVYSAGVLSLVADIIAPPPQRIA